MKSKKLPLLLALVFATWLVPNLGKRFVPGVFDLNAIQWSSSALLAILCPIGLLLSLSYMVTGQRRDAFFYIIGFATPVLWIFYVWAVSPAFFARSSSVLKPSYKEFDAIATLVNGASDSNEPVAIRVRAASQVYRIWGVTTVLLTENGTMVRYEPTEEDKQFARERLNVRAKIEKDMVVIAWQLEQIPWLFAGFLCLSTTVFFGGLAFHAFRRPR